MRDIVESSIAQFEASEDARLMDENFHAAFRIMTSQKAREAFDLTREPLKVRERYGMNRFGQCCLLARRLVESGGALRDHQHLPHRVRRNHLGYPRIQALHIRCWYERARLPDV